MKYHRPRPSRPSKSNRRDRPGKQNGADRQNRPERLSKPNKSDWQSEQNRAKKSNKPERQERVDKPSSSNRRDLSTRFKGKLLVKGRHEVTQALEANQKIEKIYISEQIKGSFPEQIKTSATKRNIPIEVLNADTFKNMFGYDSQGIIAITPPFEYCTLETLINISDKGSGIIVALNNVEDPGNLGATIRTVEASGCDGVIIPKHRAASITEGAIRTAQGATAFLPVAQVTNITDAIVELKKNGFWAIGLDGAGKCNHTEIVYNEKVVLVAGGENAGLGSRLEKACDDIVAIPLRGKTSSLNVSVSVAIGLYEIIRQKDFIKKV